MGALDVRRHLQEECGWDDQRMLLFDKATEYLVENGRMSKESAQLAAIDAIMAVFEPDSMPSFDSGGCKSCYVERLVSSLVSAGIDEKTAEEFGKQLIGVIGSWKKDRR